jgi:dihydrofolate synthase/folylpolyglutamate synthase
LRQIKAFLVLTYKETIEYLYSRLPVFHRIGAAALKPGLQNTHALLKIVGNPEVKFKSIHIAGTNGKGSTSHYLAAILQCAGYKTGLYTSPHVKDFRERIRLNGQMISKAYVVKFVEEELPKFEGIDASFFELTVALAFKYFAEKKVDIAVIETGLGGRLDSTNVITPELSVITNIGFDHTDLLGNTLPEIAAEKAGIIKPSTPVVIGETNTETQAVFAATAKASGANILFADKQYNVISHSDFSAAKPTLGIKVQDKKGKVKEYQSELTGQYQLKNILTVLTTVDELRKLGYTIPDKAVKQGLANVVSITGLQGRWQVINKKPLAIADTGHNFDGIKQTMAQLKQVNKEQLHIVFGVVADKDLAKVLPLLPKNATYYFCRANVPRALDAALLFETATAAGLNGLPYPTVKKAYNAAKKNAAPNDVIYIGGSTFVVAEAI